MSYILDALRKADAQRERDPARGIHAQPLHGATGQPRPGGGYSPWLWIAAVVAVAAISSGAWLYRGKDAGGATPHDRPQLAEPASGAVATAALAQPAPVVGGTAAPAAPVAAPASVPAPTINPPPAPPRPMTPPVRDPRASSQPMMRGGFQPGSPVPGAAGVPAAATAAQSQPAGAPASTASVPGAAFAQPGASPAAPMTPRAPAPDAVARPAPPAVAPPRTPAISAPVPPAPPTPPVVGLPVDAPKLVLNGGVYSTNRAQRMLIVNGQVVSEGSEVAPGVVLDEIRPKTAVLRFHGARYTVSY